MVSPRLALNLYRFIGSCSVPPCVKHFIDALRCRECSPALFQPGKPQGWIGVGDRCCVVIAIGTKADAKFVIKDDQVVARDVFKQELIVGQDREVAIFIVTVRVKCCTGRPGAGRIKIGENLFDMPMTSPSLA